MAATATYDSRPRYSYPTCGGTIFHVSTGVGGVAPGTALSTTPPLILWNPLNSGKLVSLVKLRLGYVSGTLGAGSIVIAQCTQVAAPTGGTVLTPVCGLIGGASGALKAYQGATLSATPTIITPLASMTAALATTAVGQFVQCVEEIAGEISIPPGIAVCLQGVAAAGTSPLIIFGASYDEETYTNNIST